MELNLDQKDMDMVEELVHSSALSESVVLCRQD